SATPRVSAVAGAGQLGEAFWFVRRGPRRADLFLAGAVRSGGAAIFGRPAAGAGAFGFVARATFRRERRREFHCRGRGIGREIDPTQFEVDPLLRSAKLTMQARGTTHVVRWTGRGEAPDPDLHGEFGNVYFFSAADLDRSADARGRLFDRFVRARTNSYAYLDEGAGGFFFVRPGVGPFRF
ncbi:MAG TPA: hypothetical protein VG709_07490, partial [Actinomycetota bacterium]|nr:hypothetical protein [Actinomycetota bacterium]